MKRRRRKRPGPKYKATPEKRAKFLQAIRAGNTREASCAYAGFSVDTLARTLERLAGFAEKVSETEAESEVEAVAIVRKAFPTDVKAAQWWLERRRSKDWAARTRTELSGYVGNAPDLTKLTDEELAQWMALAAKTAAS